jgi:hypothetical protein
MRLHRHAWKFGLRAATAILIVAAVAAGVMSKASEADNADTLRIQVAQVRSNVASTALLAQQFSRRQVTLTFARAQVGEVQKKLRSESDDLASLRVEPRLEPRKKEAMALALAFEAELGKLLTGLESETTAESEGAMRRLLPQFVALEKSLKA